VFPEEVEEVFGGNARIRRLEGGHVRGEDLYIAFGKKFPFDLRKNRDMILLDREIAKDIRSLARMENIPTRRLVNRLLGHDHRFGHLHPKHRSP